MKRDRSYGVVPVLKDQNGEYLYLIVFQTTGSWSFPKGHPDANEDPLQTARRELAEETGITKVVLEPDIYFDVEYTHMKDGERVHKTVRHFIGYVHDQSVVPQEGEVIDWKWVRFDEAVKLLHQNTVDDVLTKAEEHIHK